MKKELKEMTSKELQAVKEVWYNDAIKEGKISKLCEICRNLGENIPHNYGPKYKFHSEDIEIYVDDYGNYMTVHKGGKLIVSTHNEKLYVIGVLDNLINKFYATAAQITKNKEVEKEKEKVNKLLSQLSI